MNYLMNSDDIYDNLLNGGYICTLPFNKVYIHPKSKSWGVIIDLFSFLIYSKSCGSSLHRVYSFSIIIYKIKEPKNLAIYALFIFGI